MGAVPILAGAALVGTGVQIYGQISAAQAQKDAADLKADLQRAQALELLNRQTINEDILKERSEFLQKQYIAQAAHAGSGGGGLGGVLRIKRDLEHNILIGRREAEFKATQLRMGADIEQNLTSDLLTSAYLGAAGTLLKSGAEAYSYIKKEPEPLKYKSGRSR